MSQGIDVIRMRDVCRTYPGPPPVTALRDIDLTIESGEYVAVTGPSGPASRRCSTSWDCWTGLRSAAAS